MLIYSSKPAEGDVYKELDDGRIRQIAQMLPESPAGFGPNYRDRATYDALARLPAFARCLKDAETVKEKEFPKWDDDLYLDCTRTGRRPPGERMMTSRLERLFPLVWAECLENKGRFTSAISVTLHELASQPTWTLPAHDQSLQSFHGTKYEVDLAAASVAHDLAQALYMLDDKVPAEVRNEVLAAIRKRVFDPVDQSFRTGKQHWWLGATSNWNAVCLAGVTGAALCVLEDRHDRAVFVAAAEHYARHSVEGFTDDGYCSEGVGYFNYGFGHYIKLREELLQATGGKVDLFADQKVKNIAMFGPHIEILDGVFPAIADCRFGSKVNPQILWYCSRTLGLGLKSVESRDMLAPGARMGDVMFAFANSASNARPAADADQGPGLRSYFENAGILICRPLSGGRFGAAIKGGHNAEHHNHNDVGSFSIALGKQLPVCDPGGPHAYAADTFKSVRYTKYQMFRSRTHPVPLVAGREQREGADARAKVLWTKFGDEVDEIAMDLRSAYDVPGLNKLTRIFRFSRLGGGQLEVIDQFEFAAPESFEITLPTHGQAKQTAKNAIAFIDGQETLVAEIHAPGEWDFEQETIEENAPPFTCARIKLKQKLQAGEVRVVLRPAK